MTVRKVLDKNRKELKDKVNSIVLCKRELFYLTKTGICNSSVYPVSVKSAAEEAMFFGVEWSEQ